MGFLDVVSGKIFRWNRMRQDAYHQATNALKAFLLPGGAEAPVEVRNYLYLFFVYANRLVGCLRETQSVKDRLYSLNTRSHLCVLSSLHAFHAVGAYYQHLQGIVLWLKGIQQMYQRNDDFGLGWYSSLANIPKCPTADDFRLMLGRRMYEEIAPILGLSPNRDEDVYNWMGVVVCIGNQALVHCDVASAESREYVERLMNCKWFQQMEDSLIYTSGVGLVP